MKDLASIGEFVNRVRSRFTRTAEIPSDGQRASAALPPDGSSVSLEMALNSRCNCDHDEHQELFHWGLFDKERTLSPEQVAHAVKLLRTPRFLDHLLAARSRGRTVTFCVDRRVSGRVRDWLMIESGMQQQAMCLVCAALGIGTVFRNLGQDGKPVSEAEHETIQMELDAMKPSYDGSYWTDQVPMAGRPWKPGNLPDPARRGSIPLITTLTEAQAYHQGPARITSHQLGQLMWAARGRTPHLYKSRHWGLTIPTWGGRQDITRIYLVADGAVHAYVNWTDGLPTHSLSPVSQYAHEVDQGIRRALQPAEKIIVVDRMRAESYALWEVGYQLLNLILQAHNLDLTYRAVLLDTEQRALLREAGIENPEAAIGFQ